MSATVLVPARRVADAAEPTGTVGVFLIGDDGYFRRGLRQLLTTRDERLRVVGDCHSPDAALARLAGRAPAVVLIDVHLPHSASAEAIRRLTASNLSLRVLVLTDWEDDHGLLAAIHAGACGYLPRATSIGDLVDAIHTVAEGGSVLAPLMISRLLDHVRAAGPKARADRDGSAALTPRELDVLRLLAAGLENAAIASELVISTRTARNHVASILAKLELDNRIQAAVYAVTHGLA